ncbi:MAG: phosphatase [Desulfobacteraceae bacterium 4572_88]|nr:MAG: phosphatase [Desulfobacteraceae bacterium 4572_88]RLC21436.1 MAG: PHP domain-containing protein [Deltaproteobacteria bacterium]
MKRPEKKPSDCDDALKIDLHIHSTASDGTFSPKELLNLAICAKLAAIAITDHDTLAGSKEAITLGIPPSLCFLTGVEISANPPPSFPCSGSLHILGYGIRLDDSDLNQTLEVLQKARKDRNPQVIDRLNHLGMDISLAEVVENFGEGGQIGRPHIARLMKKKGYVPSIDEAFDRYLGKGRPAYADKYRVDCDKAIEIIRKAGGVAVLAHPVLLKSPDESLSVESLVRDLAEMGLRGIEVFYPEHSAHHMALYTEMARRYDLLMTGGTDFHGAVRPGIQMGSGKGDFSVPYELYEKLIQACT